MKQSFLCALVLFFVFNITVLNAQNNSLDFDGNDDYIHVDDVTLPTEFTVEFQFKAGEASLVPFEERIFSVGATTRLEIGLKEQGNGTQLWVFDQNRSISGVSYQQDVRDGNWHHFAITQGEGSAKIYFDGAFIADYSTTIDAPPFGPTMRLGAWVGGLSTRTFFNGEIDEVRIWSRVRNAEEITESFDCQISGQEEQLFAYWNFNQGTAGADNLEENNLIDRSGNNRNGELRNFNLMDNNSNWLSSGNPDELCGFVSSTTSVFVEEWQIYPNPTRNFVYLSSENAGNYLVHIYNQQGQHLQTLDVVEGEAISLQNQPSGMYFVVIIQDSKTQLHKVVKQ